MEFLKLDIQFFGASATKTNNTLTSKTGGNKGTVYASFTEADPTANDIANNQTRIKPYGKFTQVTGSYAQYNTPKLVLTWYDNNENKSGKVLGTTNATALSKGDYVEVDPKEFAVKHLDDGTLKGYLKAEWQWTGGGYACATGNATTDNTPLTKIPRVSGVTASSTDIEKSNTIKINSASNTFTHNLKLEFGDITSYVDDNGGLTGDADTRLTKTDFSVIIPKEWYNEIPNEPSGTCNVTCETYSEDTLIGTATTTFTATANKDACTPFIDLGSVLIKDTNFDSIGLTGDEWTLLNNVSKPRITLDIGAKNGASLTSVIFKNGTKSVTGVQNENGLWIGAFNTPLESKDFTIEVIDSREYSATKNTSIADESFINYFYPQLEASVKRNAPTDGVVNLLLESGKFFVGTIGENENDLNLFYRYKLKSSDEWSSNIPLEFTDTNNDGTIEEQTITLNEAFNYQQAYDFEIFYEDICGLYSILSAVTKGIPTYWWNDEMFNVNGVLKVNGEPLQASIESAYPIGSIYMNINSTNPKDLFGFGEWEALEDRFLIGASSKYTEAGGSETHEHTVASHRHTQSDHTHKLNDSGYACIYYGGSTFYSREITKSNAFTATSYKNVSGTAGTNTKAQGYATTLAGVTGSVSATTYTSYSDDLTTSSSSSLPPYLPVYMWKRTA